jgi:hypothetical protein
VSAANGSLVGVTVFSVAADHAVLTGMPPMGALLAVAPDERYVLCRPGDMARVRDALAAWAGSETDILVLAVTGGWAIRALFGPDAIARFAGFCECPVPARRPVLVQGALFGCRTKSIVSDEGVLILVDAPSVHAFDAALASVGVIGNVDPEVFGRILGALAGEVVT